VSADAEAYLNRLKTMRYDVGILAGGRSTRMGVNKAFLTLENESFLKRLTKEFAGESIILSAAQKGIYESDEYKVVYDTRDDYGPMEGIYQILKHADKEYVFICAVDMPFLKKDIADYLYEFVSSDTDVVCITDKDRIHPLCAIYSVRILDKIEQLLKAGKLRLRDILDNVRTKYVSIEKSCYDKKCIKNINTKEEYLNCVKPVVFAVSGSKNSGKTFLIEKLINEFIEGGFRVAVIKHDGHDYTMDHEGTDTDRFYRAGAEYTCIFNENKYSINAAKKTEVQEMIKCVSSVDIVILEGFKQSEYPKVELVRKAAGTKRVCSEPVICIGTDCSDIVSDNKSCFDLNSTKEIYSCILDYFGLKTEI